MNVFIKQKQDNLFDVHMYMNTVHKYIGVITLSAKEVRNFLVKYDCILNKGTE